MSFHLQVYLVRLWLGGCWRDIIVDDRLPCIGNGRSTCAEDPIPELENHQGLGVNHGWKKAMDIKAMATSHIVGFGGWMIKWVLDGFGGSLAKE